MKLALKCRNALNYILTTVIIFFIRLSDRETREKTLLLIRLDAIGDYILFRNFIEVLRNSDKFRDYHITFCGNIAWKNLAETFEKGLVDDFIWINRKKFYKSLSYKYRILKKIFRGYFETVIETTYSREILYGDTIVKAAKALTSIGSKGAGEKHAAWKKELFTDKIYSEIINISGNNLFEFEINKKFFEELLNNDIKIEKPLLDVGIIRLPEKIKNKFVLIFPGAGQKERMWSGINYREISEYILNNYHYDIVLSGSLKESYLFGEIVTSNFKRRCLNLFGCTLVELAKLISEAKLLISNDTSAIHMSASVNTPFICISNGNHFGRFHPYPKEIFDKAYYIYPPEIMNGIDNFELLSKKYRFGSDLDINEIKPVTVEEAIKKIL